MKFIYSFLQTTLLTFFATLNANLNPIDRPQDLQEKIIKIFSEIEQSECRWSCNGEYGLYKILNVDEAILAINIIRHGYIKGQRVFNFLDIGSGMFKWVDVMAEQINKAKNLPQDIAIHIWGIRGEIYDQPTTEIVEKCITHKLGSFCIENIHLRPDILENGEFDLIVSDWTLRHLVDPVGTFCSIYNLLRPETGLFFFNGFFWHSISENTFITEEYDENMIKLMLLAKLNFLMRPWSDGKDINQFVVQRSSDADIQLPIKYHSFSDGYKYYQNNSQCITRFLTPIINFELQTDDEDPYNYAKILGNNENIKMFLQELKSWPQTYSTKKPFNQLNDCKFIAIVEIEQQI